MNVGARLSVLELKMKRNVSWGTTRGDMNSLWKCIATNYCNLQTLHVEQPPFVRSLSAVYESELVSDMLESIERVDAERWCQLVPVYNSTIYEGLKVLRIIAFERMDPWQHAILGFRNLHELTLVRISPFPRRQQQLVETVLHRNSHSLRHIHLRIGTHMPERTTPHELILPVNTYELRSLEVELGPGWSMKLAPVSGTDHLQRNHRVQVEIGTIRSTKQDREDLRDVLKRVFRHTGDCVVHAGAIRRKFV